MSNNNNNNNMNSMRDGGGNNTPTMSNRTTTVQASPHSSPSSEYMDSSNKERRMRRMRVWWSNIRYFEHQAMTTKIVLLGVGCIAVITIYVLLVNTILRVWTFYSPRIPVAGVDIHVPTEDDWPLIHIVHSRFMQEQGALETLGMARFHLFMTFCFPTMIAQSTQKFFWIIKTDQRFTSTTVFSLLLDVVKDHPNIYIVSSNCNYSFGNGGSMSCWDHGESWRDGAEPRDILRSNVYSGNMHKLRQAMALRSDRIVLETRLDADDGLHMYYLQYMPVLALSRFKGLPTNLKSSHHQNNRNDNHQERDEGDSEDNGDEDKDEDGEDGSDAADNGDNQNAAKDSIVDTPQWLYWCTRRHLEWHSELDNTAAGISHKNGKNVGDGRIGHLQPIQHEKLCITPGITVGYNVGTDPAIVPKYAHDQLFLAVNGSQACYDFDSTTESTATATKNEIIKNEDDSCLELVDDFLFCAIRSRTPTSAGMLKVALDPSAAVPKKLEKKLWRLLIERFNMNQTRVTSTQEFLIRNRKLIAHENIIGQCTTGHSCKSTAKSELRKYIEEDNQQSMKSK
mmetsp:Transcript_22459/g.53001  ORF Transcript_22459/g.53001 Transcript_22459/m.53001 type:complete len:566 (-) Transcript_22459:1688-3385(-)